MKSYTGSQTNVERGPSSRMALSLLLILLTLVLSACGTVSGDGVSGSEPEATPMETDSSVPPYDPTPEPDELEACLEQGGQWDVLGKSGPGCNLPTGDGGKACQDSEECESLCLADTKEVMKEEAGVLVPDLERIGQLNAQEDQLSGTCSSWQYNFGCSVVVEDGTYQEICID